MKIDVAMRFASDCVRHVLKEDRNEIKYPYLGKERQHMLQQRVKSLTETLEILREIEILNE